MTQRYDPSCFDVSNIPAAKAIILTPEDSTTEKRWATETPYIGALIREHLNPLPHHLVLDYGCGIGRLSRELIERCGCDVVGVDTSVSMRALAPAYVESNQFFAVPPRMLGSVSRTQLAIAVWTLQHIPDLGGAVELIHGQLRSFGRLFVLNMTTRALPTSDGGHWIDDGKDVRELLATRFKETVTGTVDAAQTTPATAKGSFWGIYQRRD